MNTIFNKSFFAIVSLFAVLLVGSSCEDNIGIKVTDEAPNADKTLYEVIMNDPELTDFVEVLNACNIRSEKNPAEIISVADSLFNTSRVYTVWAPKNGSFDKEDILARINAGYRDDVMKTFVFSHVANYLKAAKGKYEENGELILMLNNKKLTFDGSYKTGYTLEGKELISVNNRVKNGILHKLSSASEYNYNIWEYIYSYSQNTESVYKVDSMVNYLYSYNDTAFAEHLSIRGPIVSGNVTYLDSAFEISNKLLSKYNGGVGNLDNEDSLYTFYLPTNDLWDKMIEKGEKHFNYRYSAASNEKLIDSLKLYYPRYYMTKYLTYSDFEQRYVPADKQNDSVMPVQYEYPRKLFSKEDLEACVVDTKVLSNGTVKIINKFPYSIFDLWHDTIRIEAEDQYLMNQDPNKSKLDFMTEYTVYEKDINPNLKGTTLSGSRYIKVQGAKDATNADDRKAAIQYYVPNIKSATYKVALIFVPENIVDPDRDPGKKIVMTCSVLGYDPESTTGLEINTLNGELDKKTGLRKGEKITLDPKKGYLTQVDTVVLEEPVKIRVCEYNSIDDIKTVDTGIRLVTDGMKINDNAIRLDAILLIPVEDEDAE